MAIAFMQGFRHSSTYFPLVAAIFAPLSTLLDIPALAQPWYLFEGKSIKDPLGCFVLSAVGLGFNAVANALLVLRFSGTKGYWQTATRLSVASWVIKTILAVANLAAYGARSRNKPGFTYSEGFWSAVASVIMAGIIAILLLVHFALQSPARNEHGTAVRIAGKHFMVSVMAFLSLIAIEAVTFSQLESWTYFDGIYFSVVSAMTIGFGDYEPTRVASRILLFPCAVLSISLLAVLVTTIINYLAERTNQRKARMRAEVERKARENRDEPKGTQLVQEISILNGLAAREVIYNRAVDLAASIVALVVFWTIGAAIFSGLEGWSYPTALYFCYVFFLTIGYGDFSPQTPGGRVVFVIYSLMAVPIITSFVVQTVTSVANTFAEHRMEKAQDRRNPTSGQERAIHSHAWHVEESHRKLGSPDDGSKETKEHTERELARMVLDAAIRLEAQARTLLIGNIDQSTKAHILLRADQNVQTKTVQVLRNRRKSQAADQGMEDAVEAEAEAEAGLGVSEDDLEQIREYRKSFADLLASGSLLLKLEGDEKWEFERRIEGDAEDFGGILLGEGRRGPAEERLGIDV